MEYEFKGHVLDRFGKVIASNYKARTIAKSKAQAENNIKYRINSDMGKLPSNKLTLSGTITEIA